MFTVIWTPAVHGEFAAIVFSHPDRLVDLDDAVQEIDDLLRFDPTGYGEHLSEGLWRMAAGPLVVFYFVEDDQVVLDKIHWAG